jgi:small subunit ribosomal protein S17
MYTRRRAQVGVVVGNKMQKTVIVAVEKHKRHLLYKKSMRLTRRYKAHDEKDACLLGDTVRIIESRPLSREKRWRVVEIIARHEVAEVAPREIDSAIIERIAAAKPAPPKKARAAVAQAEPEPAAAPEAPAEGEPETEMTETVSEVETASTAEAVAEAEPETEMTETVSEVETASAAEAVAEAEPETDEEETKQDGE